MTIETMTNTCAQQDTKSNPTPNPKQHAVVNIELNRVTCPTYPEKFIRDMLLHRLYQLTIVIVTQQR